jgi:hypothetical protein
MREKKWREMLEIPLNTHEPQVQDSFIPDNLEQRLIQTNDYSYLRDKFHSSDQED